MRLAHALTNAGRLARWLRSHHRMQQTSWHHALLANGSIVSWLA